MVSQQIRALQIAENLTKFRGDYNWFCENYTRLREYNGIMDSIEVALKNQDLWEVYQEKMKNL